mmetsp:Transcript_16460/g.45608  ORF Transcript_16460/g.45608 Transcript_16460/m.45608 type:complete len:498 (-) Transcript_16460:120-1613(-)
MSQANDDSGNESDAGRSWDGPDTQHRSRSRPLIDHDNERLRSHVRAQVREKTSKWLRSQVDHAGKQKDACDLIQPFPLQVGGMSAHKSNLLQLGNSILKPLRADHRGFRELAFYDMLESTDEEDRNNSIAAVDATAAAAQQAASLCMPNCAELATDKTKCTQPQHALLGLSSLEVAKLRQLKDFVPKYHGAMQLRLSAEGDPTVASWEPLGIPPAVSAPQRSSSDIKNSADSNVSTTYLALENILQSFSKPHIMDIKFGTQTFEPDASPEKQHREASKYPQQREFGFRLVGARLYDGDQDQDHSCQQQRTSRLVYLKNVHSNSGSGEEDNAKKSDSSGLDSIHGGNKSSIGRVGIASDRIQYDPDTKYLTVSKHFGRSLTSLDDVSNLMKVFFVDPVQSSASELEYNNLAIKQTLQKLDAMMSWFGDNRTFAFYASSILFVREGDPSRMHDLRGEGAEEVRLALIDLGRVRLEPGGDNGYRLGLTTIRSLIAQLGCE